MSPYLQLTISVLHAFRWLGCSEKCTAARLLTLFDSATVHLHLGVLSSSARALLHAASQSE